MNTTDKRNFDCEAYTLSKQRNVHYREPDVRAKEQFQLVHTDLAVPIDPIAKDGFQCAIILTDIYSGCFFTYFRKEKSDAVKGTEKFIADIAPQGKLKNLKFHTDVFQLEVLNASEATMEENIYQTN